MKIYWLSFIPLLIAGCHSQSQDIHVTSDSVSKSQIETIVNNINKMYPDASHDLRQHAAEVVVRAVENLVPVKGGTFDMGDFGAPCEIPSKTWTRIDWAPGDNCLASVASGHDGAANVHKVTLDSYSISKYETSFMDMEWMRQINQLPVAMDDYKTGKIFERGTDEYQNIVEKYQNSAAPTKNWQEAKDYCLWLGKISSLKFDLPTEAQWEYAARNRGKHVYYATNNGYIQSSEGHYYDPKIGKYIDYKEDQVNAPNGMSLDKLGEYPANPLGIYGMANQTSEWVNDWYAKNYYLHSPEKNPQGPKSGTEKVLRDGGGLTMSFGRINKAPKLDGYYPNISFRCAVNLTTHSK